MKTTRATGLLLAAALLLAGCAGTDDAADGGAGATADGSMTECVRASECTSLEPADFATLAEEDGVVLLDVRTPQEYAEGHLDGAVNLDVSAPDFADGLAGLDPQAVYAVYCRSGNRSQTALELMAQAGLEDAADLAGGIGAWVGDGLPLVAG